MSENATSPVERILGQVKDHITFHHKWRVRFSVLYFTGAAITVVSAALTTAAAGFVTDTNRGRMIVAVLALCTTVFASLEKVLKLREKWDLHRNSQVALEIIELRGQTGSVDAEKLVDMIEKVALSYSMQLGELNAGPQAGENPKKTLSTFARS